LRQQYMRGKGGMEGCAKNVKIACGHVTAGADAVEMTVEVRGLFRRIIRGLVPVKRSGIKRGVIYDYWIEGEAPTAKYSVIAPRRLAEEARQKLGSERPSDLLEFES